MACNGDRNRPPCNLAFIVHPIRLQELSKNWLKEDTPHFDFGGFIVGDRVEQAVLLLKSPGVVAGVPFFEAIFTELGCSVEWLESEGTFLQPVSKVAVVRGKARQILLGERVALNCIARASGIATLARRLNKKKLESEWRGEIAGTRKTTPGFRMVEKYALLVGGASTHRYDLSSMIMLKDNHIWTAGNITQAVQKARSVGGFCTKIEVECRGLDEASEAATAGADVVMLDNFQPQALHACARELKQQFGHVMIESSGGIQEDNITDYMGPDVDIISLSKLTQGYEVVDFSLKIMKAGHDPANPNVK